MLLLRKTITFGGVSRSLFLAAMKCCVKMPNIISARKRIATPIGAVSPQSSTVLVHLRHHVPETAILDRLDKKSSSRLISCLDQSVETCVKHFVYYTHIKNF